MKKRKHHSDNLYLLSKELKEKSQPLLLNDLKRGVKGIQPDFFDLPLARYILQTKKNSTLLPTIKRGRMKKIFTGQSGRYLVFPAATAYRKVDSLFFDSSQPQPKYIYATFLVHGDVVWEELKKKYSSWAGFIGDLASDSIPKVSLVRAWNVSIIGAVIFGMVTMTFIYRYLGESVSAKIDGEKAKNSVQIESRKGEVLGAEDYAIEEAETEFITRLIETYDKNGKKNSLEKEIRAMVKGYPIESMIPEIAKQDRIVAAFLVAIAKKESSWGTRVPVYQGQDCYNYWGWRGKNPIGSGGHTCFDSPEDAVETVAKRIAKLIDEHGRNTPEEMVVWKCGRDCEATGGQAAANKWISDVNLYFKKLNK